MSDSPERGSTMVLAVFVLVLLSGVAIALLFLSETELKMSRADVRSKTAYFLAESGLEDARGRLYDRNRNGPFSDDLAAAAGANGSVDFDPSMIRAVYGTDGVITGFTGYGDDVPLRTAASVESGWYIAFLTNDPLDGRAVTTDANNRVLITGVGAGAGRSFEIVQAVVELRDIMPTPPPATITLLGPDPEFDSGSSTAKKYVGDDCAGAGAPGLFVPTVGTIGADAKADAQAGIRKPGSFNSGPESGADTVADLTDASEPTVVGSGMGPIDPLWVDCKFLFDLVERMWNAADVICVAGHACPLTATTPDRIVFAEGDLEIDHTVHGQGVLLVTGTLEMHGRASWNGVILIVGEGRLERSGGGNGDISGAVVVADIAGPDDVFGTADDCTGGDGGFAPVLYDESGGGTGDLIYCTLDLIETNPVGPYAVVDFRQF